MKKKYLFILIVFLLSVQISWGQTLIISEVADPGDQYKARFVELYNASGSSIDLSTGSWTLTIQSNGATLSDITLTGTISSGGTYTIATNSSDFNSAYGFYPDQSSGYISGNGNDGYYLYSGGGNSTGTLIDAYGVLNEDGSGKAWEYTDSHAVRNASICNANTSWSSSEWTISSANVADMTPSVHTCDCPSSGPANPTNFQVTCQSEVEFNITWTKPTGSHGSDWDGVVVFALDAGNVDADPTDNNASADFTASTTYGSGTQDGTSYCVANQSTDADGNITITGLTAGHTYYFKAWTYLDDGDPDTWSLGTSNISADATVAPVTSVTSTAGDQQITLNWTNPSAPDCYDQVIIIAREASNVESDVSKTNLDGILEDADFVGHFDADWSAHSNTDDDVYDISANLIGTDNTNYAVYRGTGTSTTITGLTNGTTYYFRIFTEDGNGASARWSNGIDINETPTDPPVSLAYQGFEVDPATPADTWNYSGGTTSEVSSRYYSGSQSCQVGGTSTVTFNNINISAYESVVLSVAFSAEGCDSGEDLYLDISYDNGSTWTGTGSVKLVDGYSNANIAFGSTNASNPTTVASNPWTVNIDDAETQIAVRFRTTGLDANEYYYIDEVKLDGIAIVCNEPTTNASAITFSSVTNNSMTVSWTKGNGDNRIVVAKKGAAVDWVPTDANTYTANSSFGTGTELGSGNYVVYSGNANTVDISNLSGGTTYYFAIFEYNCTSGNEDYLVDGSAPTGNQTTLLNNVTNLEAPCIDNNSIYVIWDSPEGEYDSVLVTVRDGGTPSNPSCNGNTLISPNTDFSSASIYCGNSTSSKYVYNNTGNSVTITGLTNGSTYTFKVFTWQNNNWSSGTLITKTINVVDVSNAQATRGNTTLDISWANPNNCFDEILVVGKDNTVNGAITSVPSGDGTAYTANTTFGTGGSNAGLNPNEYCIYKGTGSSFTVTNLINGDNYCFKIFVRNGTQWSSGITVCETPQNITIIEPGDLMIMAVNTNNTNIPGDEFTFVCFKQILVGTPIDFTDNGWERVFSNKWGTTEGTIRLTRTAGGNLAAGTCITVVMVGTNGRVNSDFNVFVGGTEEIALGYWSITLLNSSDGAGFNLNASDDIWMMQNGSWAENTTGGSGDPKHDDDYTGNILYGWTATGWPGSDAAYQTSDPLGVQFSNLYPYTDCFNTDVSGIANNSKVKYTGPMTTATQLQWIARVNNASNWTGYSSDANYDNATPKYRQNGNSITISSGGYSDGIWTGAQNTNWFDCGNWQSLKVPDENTDVELGAAATRDAVIDDAATDADKYNGIANCKDLTISNQSLILEGDANDIINVYGELNLNTGGVLDMSDGTSTPDGVMNLYGNWRNNDATAAFLEGQSTIIFKGNSQQTMNSSVDETFYNLEIQNTSAQGVQLNNSTIINGKLTLNGILNLGGADLKINGDYERISRYFVGQQWSNLDIAGSGNLSPFYFDEVKQTGRFSINRAGKTAQIMTDLTTNDLQIDAGVIELSAGKNYTVNSALNNNVGTPEALILKSDANGTASLIHSTLNVPATCERYLSANNWHYIFSPLDNTNIDILTTASWGDDNPNFFWYNESIADFWQGHTIYNPTGWTAPAHSGKLLTDRGYIHRSTENYNYVLTGGNLFAGNKTFTLSFHQSGTGTESTTGKAWTLFDGWNLFGNPYPSAIDWDAIPAGNKSYIEDVVYYYDDVADKYKYYGGGTVFNESITVNGGSQYIPANQGFFVKAKSTGNGQNFTIPNSARVHSSQTFWKAPQNTVNNLVKLKISKDNYSDEMVIIAQNDAPDFHAYKMFAWDASRPQLYSTNNDKNMLFAINNILKVNGYTSVPLGISTGYAGEYTISITKNTFENTHIWIEDTYKNTSKSFDNNASYTFFQVEGIDNNRFILHFGINNAPVNMLSIDNQHIKTFEEWNLALPEGLFIDKDFGDEISISASLANGDALPDWITFSNGIFNGIADAPCQLKIRLTATDKFGATDFTDFILNVTQNTTSVTNFTDKTQIYPNPSNGIINIDLPAITKNTTLKILSVDGKIILQQSISSKQSKLDLSDYAKGTYYIEISNENSTVRKIFVLK